MSFDGRAIANFILDRSEAEGRKLSNLSLQKIVYFCHVWFLVQRGAPLIKHSFEAWQYGPVLPYLYREFKDYEDRPISQRCRRIDPLTGQNVVVNYDFDAHTEALLSQVVDFYSRINPSTLVEMTHVVDGPWYNAWNHEGLTNPGMKIPDDKIRRFYSRVPSPFPIQ